MQKPLYTSTPNKIELDLVGYVVKGASIVKKYNNSIACVMMNEFAITEPVESTDELYNIIKSLINDNGTGSKEILGAYLAIYASYSNEDVYNSAKIFVENIFLDKGEKETHKELREFVESFYYEMI